MKHSLLDGNWQYANKTKKWLFDIDNLQFDDGHMVLQTKGDLMGKGAHAPKANLEGNFSLNDVSSIEHYLPTIKLNHKCCMVITGI